MSIKLIALDIDGTLLTDDRKLQPETISAIQQAKEKGAKVVLTTGRPLCSTTPLLKKLNLDGKDNQFVVNFHGAIIETTKGGIIADSPLDMEKVAKVVELMQSYSKINLLIEPKDSAFLLNREFNWHTAFESYKNKISVYVRTFEEVKESHVPVYRIMLSADPKLLDELSEKLPSWVYSEFKVIRTESFYLEMLHPDINKGIAIQKLAEELGIKSEEIMAIGDGDSDIPMVHFAKYGIAMKNGTSSLLKNAEFVTDDNNHYGVAKAIEKYL